MSGRREFIEFALRQLNPMREMCARYGISPRVGYKWLARYREQGLAGLVDQSRRPHHSPTRLDGEPAALPPRGAPAAPPWGARKLLAYLERRHHRLDWPAPSTVAALLKRERLVAPRRRRRALGHSGRPLTPMDQPNVVWTADFRGQFRTGDRHYCYPLTIIDGCSRYLLACEALLRPTYAASQPVFRELFRRYGLPARIQTDNGVPFPASALGRLSQRSVWWIKLGITPELIEPAHPQQNGRHERLHGTLKAETTKPPAQTARAQQRRFRASQRDFNEERPHEALAGHAPASWYHRSARRYPVQLQEPEYPSHFEVRYVIHNGGVRWHNQRVNVSHVLARSTSGSRKSRMGSGACTSARCSSGGSVSATTGSMVRTTGTSRNVGATAECYRCPRTAVLPNVLGLHLPAASRGVAADGLARWSGSRRSPSATSGINVLARSARG